VKNRDVAPPGKYSTGFSARQKISWSIVVSRRTGISPAHAEMRRDARTSNAFWPSLFPYGPSGAVIRSISMAATPICANDILSPHGSGNAIFACEVRSRRDPIASSGGATYLQSIEMT
jgi:hypothetical protein